MRSALGLDHLPFPVLVLRGGCGGGRARRPGRRGDAAHLRRLFRHLHLRAGRAGAAGRVLCADQVRRPAWASTSSPISPRSTSTGCCSRSPSLVFLTGWLINRSRLGFAMRIIGNDETVARHFGINTARAEDHPVHDLGRLHRHGGRDPGAALLLCRAAFGLQSDDLVPGGHHGAARRHAPAVGAAGRRHPVHAS